MADVTEGLIAADKAVASGKGVELHAPSVRAHAPVRMWNFIGMALFVDLWALGQRREKPDKGRFLDQQSRRAQKAIRFDVCHLCCADDKFDCRNLPNSNDWPFNQYSGQTNGITTFIGPKLRMGSIRLSTTFFKTARFCCLVLNFTVVSCCGYHVARMRNGTHIHTVTSVTG